MSWFQRSQESTIPPLIVLCALITILTTVGIVVILAWESIRFFQKAETNLFDFLTGTELNADVEPEQYGILPLIWGTGMIAVGSSLIALPIGLLSAIFLSEYAPRWDRNCL